ncbi:MAG TPA: hypothetical protein VG936_01330 [Lacunisphaera sp.]|nr:hypothetical protein [Lacunisphaera sp.]
MAVGSLCTAVWLWGCWCGFPAIPWNDIRVAPAVALHRGISAFSTASAGPLSTWTYGPVPILLLWPAGFASGAAGAVQVAGIIHIITTIAAFALVAFGWPTAAGRDGTMGVRFGAALLCVLLVRNPTSGFLVFCADAPGIAFGLGSLLALARGDRWTAAVCAAAAAGCKQTMVDVGLAEFVWLWVAGSPRDAIHHLARCAAAGLVLAAASVALFGGAAFWYTAVVLPGRFPSAPWLPRLLDHGPYLLAHVGLPVLIMSMMRRRIFRRDSPYLLPALAFLVTLPLGFAGLLKVGGNVNSLHSFWLWFPPTLVVFAADARSGRFGRLVAPGLALLTAAVSSCWLVTSRLPARPNLRAYDDAARLTQLFPQRIWFPLHPLITLYSDGRLYHDLDGMTVRRIAGVPVSDEQFFSGMPAHREVCAMLLPVGWAVTDIRLARLPAGSTTRVFGVFQLDGVFKDTEPNR